MTSRDSHATDKEEDKNTDSNGNVSKEEDGEYDKSLAFVTHTGYSFSNDIVFSF